MEDEIIDMEKFNQTYKKIEPKIDEIMKDYRRSEKSKVIYPLRRLRDISDDDIEFAIAAYLLGRSTAKPEILADLMEEKEKQLIENTMLSDEEEIRFLAMVRDEL